MREKAWYIYSKEIGEDGVTMFPDVDANKLVRRAYRLAEIFMRYQFSPNPAHQSSSDQQQGDPSSNQGDNDEDE